MKKITIRKANINDSETIDYLFKELICYESRFSTNIVENITINGDYETIFNDDCNIILLAETSSHIIGFIYVFEKELDDVFLEKEAFIEAIFIEEEYRDKGVGKSLLLEVEKWCEERSIKYIDIDVMKANTKTISILNHLLYKKTKIGLRKDL